MILAKNQRCEVSDCDSGVTRADGEVLRAVGVIGEAAGVTSTLRITLQAEYCICKLEMAKWHGASAYHGVQASQNKY